MLFDNAKLHIAIAVSTMACREHCYGLPDLIISDIKTCKCKYTIKMDKDGFLNVLYNKDKAQMIADGVVFN